MNSDLTSPAPQLSVVVVILTRRKDYLVRCLAALTKLSRVGVPEIIVPCDESARTLLTLGDQFPEVEFLSVSGKRTYAELRAIGVRHSQGRIVALTEDHCTPAPDWSEQILRAHASSNAVIGGAVDKKDADSSLNWALYLADYLRYMNPIAGGPTNTLTDCNVTYKRTALDAIKDIWLDQFHEPVVHEALRARNESLWLDPQIVVYQQKSLGLRAAISDRFAFGRLFASTRSNDFSTKQRLFYCVLTFALPALLVGRIAAHILSKRRRALEFIRSLPFLVLISTVWAAGEFVGYVTRRAGSSLTAEPQRVEPLPTSVGKSSYEF